MGGQGKERPSDKRMYTHRLDVGTPVWSSPESDIDTPPTLTSTPWTVFVRGGDRRNASSVPARIGRIRDAREDQGFRPGDTIYVQNASLTKRTTEQRMLQEIATLPEMTPFNAGEELRQVYLPGFERKPHEQGNTDFTDFKKG